ncbi:hypothetical protein INS49_012442 [Diaporthe citri]|uniref:uncharacterized protein n=1 Tax=Diaporthe citri TaxID=83186 RepID=UPI001C826CBF|nr:uncharacterized protein INS49_012442 [Diaporthe citri]KAG6358922.1 hypothetical protein INS49_012442 [Diaporthe citri]
MSPEDAQQVIHQWVYFSVYQVANNRPILHDGCVQNICDALFGPEWNQYTNEEQQAKRDIIWAEYNRMFRDYLPMLQQFQHDTNEILRLDEAALATLLRRPSNDSASNDTTSGTKTSPTKTSPTKTSPTKTSSTKTRAMKVRDTKIRAMKASDAFDEPIDESILTTAFAIERDEAARKNLDKYYEPCQQGRKDLIIRRAKEPEGNIDLFDHKAVPLNDDKRTKNCPKCGKSVTSNGIKRHVQITHEKDPRWVIYCPAPGCKYECWRGDATILAHMAYYHEGLHREIFGEEDVQKQAKARAKGNEGVKARRLAKIEADAKAKDGKSAVSESEEQRVKESELAEDHLRGEALEFEVMPHEDLYDEVMSEENMPTQHTPVQHMPTQHVPNLYMPNPYVPNQYMPTQSMPNQHMPNLYVPTEYMPNQHMPNQHMPSQHMPNQRIPDQHMTSQYMPNGYAPNEQMLDEEISDWKWATRR